MLKLSKYGFSLTFGVVYLLLLGGSLWFFTQALRQEVQTITEAANSSFTRALVNNQWVTLRPILGLDRDAAAAKSNPELLTIDKSIRAFAQGTDLVKVKIYNLKGLTLYSSDPAQIGEDKSSNAGFKLATKGRVASELNYRGKFGAFDGELYNRNLVSSYVPVRGPQGVEAVVEVYTDRTESIEMVDRRVYELATSLALLLGVSFVFLYWYTGRHTVLTRDAPVAVTSEQANVLPGTAGEYEGERLRTKVLAQLGASIQMRSGALDGVVQQLMGTPLDATQAKLVQALVAMGREDGVQAHHLEMLRQWADGDWVMVAAPFDLRALLGSVTEQQAPMAREKHIDVQVYVAPDLPANYNGDREKLSQVLQLAMRYVIGRAAAGVLQFKAQTGAQGLQIDLMSGATDGTPGQALELLLAQCLVRAMGVDLRVQNTTGQGDWLSLILPVPKERS